MMIASNGVSGTYPAISAVQPTIPVVTISGNP